MGRFRGCSTTEWITVFLQHLWYIPLGVINLPPWSTLKIQITHSSDINTLEHGRNPYWFSHCFFYLKVVRFYEGDGDSISVSTWWRRARWQFRLVKKQYGFIFNEIVLLHPYTQHTKESHGDVQCGTFRRIDLASQMHSQMAEGSDGEHQFWIKSLLTSRNTQLWPLNHPSGQVLRLM